MIFREEVYSQIKVGCSETVLEKGSTSNVWTQLQKTIKRKYACRRFRIGPFVGNQPVATFIVLRAFWRIRFRGLLKSFHRPRRHKKRRRWLQSGSKYQTTWNFTQLAQFTTVYRLLWWHHKGCSSEQNYDVTKHFRKKDSGINTKPVWD